MVPKELERKVAILAALTLISCKDIEQEKGGNKEASIEICTLDEIRGVAKSVQQDDNLVLSMVISDLIGPYIPYDKEKLPSLGSQFSQEEMLKKFRNLDSKMVPADCLDENGEAIYKFSFFFNTQVLSDIEK